ncbi:hypothetical protein RFI_33052, partial [Reticulomyxa filosa]
MPWDDPYGEDAIDLNSDNHVCRWVANALKEAFGSDSDFAKDRNVRLDNCNWKRRGYVCFFSSGVIVTWGLSKKISSIDYDFNLLYICICIMQCMYAYVDWVSQFVQLYQNDSKGMPSFEGLKLPWYLQVPLFFANRLFSANKRENHYSRLCEIKLKSFLLLFKIYISIYILFMFTFFFFYKTYNKLFCLVDDKTVDKTRQNTIHACAPLVAASKPRGNAARFVVRCHRPFFFEHVVALSSLCLDNRDAGPSVHQQPGHRGTGSIYFRNTCKDVDRYLNEHFWNVLQEDAPWVRPALSHTLQATHWELLSI